jgi:hypothetical protein
MATRDLIVLSNAAQEAEIGKTVHANNGLPKDQNRGQTTISGEMVV